MGARYIQFYLIYTLYLLQSISLLGFFRRFYSKAYYMLNYFFLCSSLENPYKKLLFSVLWYFYTRFRLKYVQATTNMKNASKIVDEAFANLDFIPDLFVFLDDVIYKGAIDIINNDKKRYRNSKIITLSNEDMNFPDNVCQITFDPPSVAEKAFDLLYKLINKEYISEPIIYIDPILINEERLNLP